MVNHYLALIAQPHQVDLKPIASRLSLPPPTRSPRGPVMVVAHLSRTQPLPKATIKPNRKVEPI